MTNTSALVGAYAANNYGAPIPGKHRMVGLEIEIEGVGSSHVQVTDKENTIFSVTTDNSLRNNGVEFVSKPVVPNDLAPHMKYFVEVMKKQSWIANVRTGIHVHVDCRDLTLADLRALMTAYALLEPALMDYVGPLREECIYCVPWYRADNEIDLIAKGLAWNVEDFMKTICPITSKYSALYLEPLRRFGTVEFRHAPVWDDADKIMTWTRACASLVDFSRKRTAKQMYSMWNSGPTYFARAALGEGFPVPNSTHDLALEFDCDYIAMRLAGMTVSEKDWKRIEKSIPPSEMKKISANRALKETKKSMYSYLYSGSPAVQQDQPMSFDSFAGATAAPPFPTGPIEEVVLLDEEPEEYGSYYDEDDDDDEEGNI